MVKGVNKTVIEINDTGNKYFERVVFFVSPEYSFMSQNKLEGKAIDYMCNGTSSFNFERTKRSKKKKTAALGLVVAGALVISAIIIFLI